MNGSSLGGIEFQFMISTLDLKNMKRNEKSSEFSPSTTKQRRRWLIHNCASRRRLIIDPSALGRELITEIFIQAVFNLFCCGLYAPECRMTHGYSSEWSSSSTVSVKYHSNVVILYKMSKSLFKFQISFYHLEFLTHWNDWERLHQCCPTRFWHAARLNWF